MKSEFLYIVALVTLKNALSQYITAIKSKYQNKILTEIMTVSEEDIDLDITGNRLKILYAIVTIKLINLSYRFIWCCLFIYLFLKLNVDSSNKCNF